MRNVLAVSVLALASLWPAVISAQSAPAANPPPAAGGTMDDIRANAKGQAFALLTPAHRTQVQTIVDQFNAGTITSPRDAVQQINAILTPDEVKAVTAIAVQTRETMMKSRSSQADGPPNGAPPNATPNGAPQRGGGAPQQNAGRFLLIVSADPSKFHRGAPPPSQSQSQSPSAPQ